MKQIIFLLVLALIAGCSQTDGGATDRLEPSVKSGVAIVDGTELYYEELGGGIPGGLDTRGRT